jgi:hypothetical protein
MIKRRKWKWIGHTLRKPQDDITKQAGWEKKGKAKTNLAMKHSR